MLRKHTDSIVIRPRVAPHVRISLIAAALVVFVLAVWGAFKWGEAEGEAKLAITQKHVEQLTRVESQLRDANKKLAAGLAQVERQLQIDKAAYQELRGMLETSNNEITGLRNEIKFYRSIISPEDGKSGVRIQDFVTVLENERQVQYKLVLIQALQHSKEFNGAVSFAVKGAENGQAKVIELSRHGTEPVAVKFKYFQNVSGTLVVPDGFRPQEIKVSVSPAKRSLPALEQWYPWPEV